jgi:prolyl oligopeptidase
MSARRDTRRTSPAVVALALCALTAACAREGSSPAIVAPPPSRVAAVTETVHGVAVTDNYRWLEGSDAEVTSWTDAQNRYTRSVLDALPSRQALENRLKPLLRIGSVTAPIVRGNRYFFARRTGAQDLPGLYVRDGALGAERRLVDPLALHSGGRASIEWFSPSPDGGMLAYGALFAGRPAPTLRLVKADDGALLPLAIENVALPQVHWLADGSGFLYERLTDPDRQPANREGVFHRLGAPVADDIVLYRHRPPAGNASSALGPTAALSSDGKWIVLSYWRDPSANDVWISRFDEYLRSRAAASRVVTVGVSGQAAGTVIGDTLFLHTTKGAPRGRVVAASTARPAEAHWRTIVSERPDATIQAVAFGRGVIAVTYLENAATVVRIVGFDGRPLGTLSQPGTGTATIEASGDRTEAYLSYESFNHPPTVFRVNLAAPGDPPRYWSGPDLRTAPSSVAVEQVTYPSKDGTPITMFVVHRADLQRNGSAPALVSGYGAGGVAMVPRFWGPFFDWVEQGGVLAVPNLRGGGEYGDRWHQAATLERKQNSMNDLVGAAEWLVTNRYTTASKMAVHGLAHGGLVAAAAVMERPDLFHAAVLTRPLVDMLRYETAARGAVAAGEYGSVADAKQFAILFAYSPYQRIRPGTSYPAMLLTAADDDPEVHPFHARKAAAALQAAAAAAPARHPVLIRIDRPAADGAALLDMELRDVVDQRVFLNWQLGAR